MAVMIHDCIDSMVLLTVGHHPDTFSDMHTAEPGVYLTSATDCSPLGDELIWQLMH